VVVAIDG